MKGGFATKRRSDEFDALVSGNSTVDAGDYAELLELVGSIRQLPEVEPRPEFVATLRERLVAEAAARPAPAALDRATAARLTPAQPAVRRERRIATVLGGFAVASATASMAVASQGALPGEVLYPVKRAIENAQTGLQSDPTDQASTRLAHAERRLDEVRHLAVNGGDDVALIEALHALGTQANEAGDLALRDHEATGSTDGLMPLGEFTHRALTELTALGAVVPSDARPALIGAVQTLRGVDAATRAACPGCVPASEQPTQLTSNLQDLLAADPPALRSLAIEAEQIAGKTPEQTVAPETDGGEATEDALPVDPTAAPTEGDQPSADKDVTDGSGLDEQAPTPDASTLTNPVLTLMDEVTNGLDELKQLAEQELESLIIDGLLGGSSDED